MSDLTKNVPPLDDFNWEEFENGTAGVSKEELDKAYEATLRKVAPHQIVDGTIVAIDKDGVVVNIGYKSEGTIPISEFAYNPDLKVGDNVKVYIVDSGEEFVLSHNIAIGVEPEPSYDYINEETIENDDFLVNQDKIIDEYNDNNRKVDKKENYNANRWDEIYDTSNIDKKQLYDESLTKKDEQGSIYSIDGKKLYKASKWASELRLAEGLEIICDKAISFHWSEQAGIREIFLPKSLRAIGDLAFFNNKSIKKIFFPDSVNYISHVNPFAGCNELEEIVTYKKNNEINNQYVIHEGFLFDRTNWMLIAELPFKHKELLDLNDKHKISFYNWNEFEIRKIGCYAFYGTEIETIDFSGKISPSIDIPDSCFCNSNVKSIKLPIFCDRIGEKAFYQSKLESINLDSVLRIEKEAFCECNLKQVSFGKYLKYIGDKAFEYCPLCYIYFKGTPIHIGERVFVSDDLDTIRCENKEMLTFDFIQKFESAQNVQLIFAKDPIPLICENRFVSSVISINDPRLEWNEPIYKLLGIEPETGEVVRLRIPVTNVFLWGVKSNNVYTIPPKYDNVNAVISLDKLYSLTETRFDNDNTLYQLFVNSFLFYSVISKENLILCKHDVLFKQTYKTTIDLYEEKDLRSEFMDSERCASNFDILETTFPTKFVSLRKGDKSALIVSGSFITDFEYDMIKTIDNVFLNKNKLRIPFLSLNYILVGKIHDSKELYGILDDKGNVTLPISYSKICACMSYIIADNQLYILEKTGFKFISDGIDPSVPVFVYRGTAAIFKSNKSYYVYRKNKLSKVEGDKYVFYSSKGYVEYYDLNAGCLYIDDERYDDDYYDSGYSQDELNDMYRDAFDGNPNYESNID